MIENSQLEEILSQDSAKAYFIGMGGIAMSAAASIAKEMGLQVEGSDSSEVYAPASDVLKASGLTPHLGYNAQNISSSKADLFVLSAGEGPQNPEVDYVLKQNLPRVGFPQLLRLLAEDKLRAVIAGTHGKTTTTGLLGHILKNIDDSSFLAGGVLVNYGKNFHLGQGHYFIFEGDEYKSEFDDPTPKFHYYQPDILVLTNLEFDHPDLFESFDDLKSEFEQLIANLPPDGLIVYNADNVHLSQLVRASEVASVSFGIDNEADYKVEQIKYDQNFTSFEVLNKFSKNISSSLLGLTEQYKIQLPGKLNVYNALAVVATLRALGFSQEDIQLEMLSYKGVKRRFEIVGTKNGITLVDDYAHHPTAVRETLDAARLKYPKAKVWAVFEPHTFSRTKATLTEMAQAFDPADEVLISEIYPAREKVSDATIRSEKVIEAIKEHNSKHQIQNQVRKVVDKTNALKILKNELKSGDVVVVMAVGEFNRLSYELKDIL